MIVRKLYNVMRSKPQPKFLGLRILAASHAYTLLLRMGNYFVRTTLSVGVVLWEEGRVKISHSRPDARNLELWDTILSFFVVGKRDNDQKNHGRQANKKRSYVSEP